jgi:hypothetical protein
MKRRYRMFLRGNVYYAHDSENGKQTSLGTRDKRLATLAHPMTGGFKYA